MPIYAYRCSSCNYENEVLQKMSDAQLTVCPACNQETYTKQLTAPGFQLKGSGWYATDFKGGAGSKAKSENKAEPPPCQGGNGSCACH
ncbi:MAG: zinc ribbon domain-containing protein [Sterolibacterium sp.]|nr:zinc ribbon domain-containing protein [Sterolibacterium sp.]